MSDQLRALLVEARAELEIWQQFARRHGVVATRQYQRLVRRIDAALREKP